MRDILDVSRPSIDLLLFYHVNKAKGQYSIYFWQVLPKCLSYLVQNIPGTTFHFRNHLTFCLLSFCNSSEQCNFSCYSPRVVNLQIGLQQSKSQSVLCLPLHAIICCMYCKCVPCTSFLLPFSQVPFDQTLMP